MSLVASGALLAPVDATATWPGQDGAIVFETYRLGGEEAATEEGMGIWSSLPGVPHGQIHRLTADPSDADPQVSPDGRWIAFSRGVRPDVNGFPTAFAIFLMRSDGSALTQVTDGLHSDGQPAFLASGRRIIFERRNLLPRDDGDLFSIGLDGSGLHQITSGPDDDRDPAVSPGGRVIAFERSNHIFTARPSGAEVKDITPQIARNEEARSPDFSPAGSRIAFAKEGNVFTMTANGRRLRRITGFSFPTVGLDEPAYSPDGKSILAVYTSRYGSSDIYLYRVHSHEAAGCNPVRLSLELRAPAWQPTSPGRSCQNG